MSKTAEINKVIGPRDYISKSQIPEILLLPVSGYCYCHFTFPRNSAFVWHSDKGTSLLSQGLQSTTVVLAVHFINQNWVWIISDTRETSGGRKRKGKYRALHVEKCLAVQQKRKHLKSERKVSAGRIKWSKFANTDSAWLATAAAHSFSSVSSYGLMDWAVDQDTERLGSFSSTAGQLSCGKAGRVASSPSVPQLSHL